MILDSFQRAQDIYLKAEDRMAKDFGLGASKAAFGLIQKHINHATNIVRAKLQSENRRSLKGLIETISVLEPEIIALAALQGALDAICECDPISISYRRIGRVIQDEVFAYSLKSYDKKLAAKLEKIARGRNASLKYRKQAVRSMGSKAGFKAGRWGDQARLEAGMWMTEVVLQLDNVFMEVQPEDRHEGSYLTLTEDALTYSQEFVRELLDRRPVSLPLLTPPPAWEGLTLKVRVEQGSYDIPLVRKAHYAVTQAYLKQALEDGTLKPVLDSLSRIQSTGWRINSQVLNMVVWSYEQGLEVPGLPPLEDIKIPPRLPKETWDVLPDDDKRNRRRENAERAKQNRGFLGEREVLKWDIETARAIIENGNRFWCPQTLDYRGRVYSSCHFNYQRADHVRGLFEFSEGKALGPDGLYWLMVHLANCGDFDKMSKKPFEDRIQWVRDNHGAIREVAFNPIENLLWTEADAPFQFLAACMEYSEAWASDNPSIYRSHLPVGFDGSCSGLQHFAAMTGCEVTAPLVNLMPSDAVADVYQTVADKVHARATQDTEIEETQEVAQCFLDYGINRDLVKRNVMTWAYSSKKFGMGSQVMTDTILPLSKKVATGKLASNPLAVAGEAWEGQKASRYLGGITYECIEQTLSRPAEAMKFLQGIARTLAHESKPVVWTTPMGFPVVLNYPNVEIKTLCLYLQDRGVRRQINSASALPGIDKAKAANAIAPSFVHSYDACHLQMVVNEAALEGIHDLALVHDSFGCHAADATKFRKVITKTFHKLYSENDVLQMAYDEACDQVQSNHHRLPQVPTRGSYDIGEVTHARYAFA